MTLMIIIYNVTVLMMTTKQQTGYGIRASICMCVSKYPFQL